MKILLIILLFLPVIAKAEIFYVTTTGTAGNSGSFASPWSLRKALSHPAGVDPGDQIYVMAGTYTDTLTSFLIGTLANPIIVKAIGRVIIDGTLAGQSVKNITAFTINGAYTWYWGLEVTNSDPERTIVAEGSNPPERRGLGMDVYGVGVKVINCIIYDTGQGLGAWTPSINSEFYGNVIFNNGWDAPDRLHGHGIYSQNNTGTKSFKDNVILNNFGYGFHFYTEVGELNNFYLQGNVEFNDDWLIGGFVPLNDIELNTNFSYKNAPQLGYENRDNDGLILTNNFFPIGLSVRWWQNVSGSGNTIFNYNNLVAPIYILFEGAAGPPDLSSWSLNNDTYYWKSPSSGLFFHWVNTAFPDQDPNREADISLANWQAAGQDASVTVTLFAPSGGSNIVLTGKKTFVRQNSYDANRANIIIYNWDLSSTVNVNVSGILSTGDSYELRNVQNYFGDVITGTFNGGDSLTVPMTGHTVAIPFGYGTAIGPNTFPEFGAFVLIKTSSVLTNYFIHNKRIVFQ